MQKKKREREKKNCPQHLLTRHIYTIEKVTEPRQSRFWLLSRTAIAGSRSSHDDRWRIRGKKREREIFEALPRLWFFWSWKRPTASSPGRERENESLGGIVGTTSITSVLAFAVYLAWDRKALKVRWSGAPSSLALLRVALSRSFRWDER